MPRDRTATYRVQLTPSFGFDAAAGIVPDLVRLGVSHLYLSPVAEAVGGSTHGYDVVDPATVRAELGGAEGLRRLATTARDHGLGLVIDIVPNHVSTVEPERNPWWWTLLRAGRHGPTAAYFDVDWAAADGRVILPVLGRPLAEAIAAGEITVDGERLRYFDRTFPLRRDEPDDGSTEADVAALLGRQHYLLQHWREPARNVRRFFTIDDLVAIRPEVTEVADAVHATVAGLAADELLDGVRVDHVDGLADPAGYLHGLRGVVGEDGWLLVEKILVGDERLPGGWEADGTTGYEWITIVDHLFTHPDGERSLTEVWQENTGDRRSFHEHERAGVRDVLDTALRPDLERVARAAGAADEPGERAIVELTAQLGRYRTYLVGGSAAEGPDQPDPSRRSDPSDPSEQPEGEADLVHAAAARAEEDLDEAGRTRLAELVEDIVAGTEVTRRWQQLTGPALAKGGEDRALYRYVRLAAHDEVGGDPGAWSRPLDDFHRHNATTAETRPATLLAGSTHDTKRSEDVRARLLALAEVPDLWSSTVEAWRAIAGGTDGLDVAAIGGPMLLLGFQTVVGAWPIDRGRLAASLVKASRESGAMTSWTDPDDHHEAQLAALAELLTEGALAAPVVDLVGVVGPAGRAISAAQLTLRLTAPGVADLYQGSESWLLTLVDPDNRAPIDPDALRRTLDAATTDADPVWSTAAPKAALITRVLATRRRNAACFAPGARYEPLLAGGIHADHVVAFVRRPPPDGGDRPITTVASRFPLSRPDGWLDTTIDLPSGGRDVLGGPDSPSLDGTVRLADLLGDHPAAVLE